ncbi:MAG: hypothetical protein H0V87_02650 [Chloroflexi bacterium]|nr:hypothetical protein [Chloroflexota bacterium]
MRVRSLLELSSRSLAGMYGGLGLLLVAGILAGIVGGHFGRGWIWASLGLLVVVIGAMYALASRYYAEIRLAVGLESNMGPRGVAPPPAASPEELDRLLDSRRPDVIGAVGGLGLLAILVLMVMKPF